MHNLVPHFILSQHAQGQTSGSFDAATLFVDISGFTTITETLMQHGTEGAETLANLMRSVFTPLIDTVYAHGGFIVGFAGDAFTAVFPTTPASPTRRATAAASTIQQTVQQQADVQTPFGAIHISSKIGVDVGLVQWGIITHDDHQRVAYYFRGPAIDGCSYAEHQAARGELIVSRDVFTAVSPHITAHQLDEHYRITQVADTLSSPTTTQLPDFTPFSTLAAQYYPQVILQQVAPGEFRQVINVFMALDGELKADELDSFMQLVFANQQTYGGLLNRIDFGDKGCNLLLFWGAPTAYENDVTRALNFLLELRANTPIPMRAAVTYTLAYAGFIGSDLREEYTCYGRGINLAARFLMQADWGTIWVDNAVAQRTQTRFFVEFIDQFQLKGFSTPQSAFLLRGRTQDASTLYRGSMVGRTEELAQLGRLVEPVRNGRFGGIITIIGEAGIGKSRLVYEFTQTLTTEMDETQPNTFICQTDEINRLSLNPFRYFLRRYFRQHFDNSDVVNKELFTAVIDNLINTTSAHPNGAELGAELNRTRSFLGSLIGLYWPDSLYAQLDPKLRFDNSIRAMKMLLLAESYHRPFVLLIEDSQWLDADSREFISILTRQVADYPFIILATARPPEVEAKFFTKTIPLEIPQTEIQLGTLDKKHIQELAANLLTGQVSPELVAQVMLRADGNPFFAEQMLLYLKEESQLTVGESGWTFVDEAIETPLPADLRTVLVARLDRLTRAVRKVVQTASVLGREFPLRLLVVMLQGDELVMEKVETAVNAAIWVSLNEIRYLFKHRLMRDAAYEMQLHNQRRILHYTAATSLETLHRDDLRPHYAELAYHFEQGGVADKAHIYLIMAANAAQDAYENHQALNFYERALALTAVDDVKTQFELLSSSEVIDGLLGNRTSQQERLTQLAHLASTLQNADYQVRVALRQSQLAESLSDFEKAVTAARRAIQIAESQLSGVSGRRFKALGEITLAESLLRLGNYEQIESTLLDALLILDEINAVREAVNGRKALASLYIYLGQYEKSESQYETTLAGYQAIGDRFGESTVLGRLGVVYRLMGKADTAIFYFERAINLQQVIGDRHGEGMARLHLGATFQNLGIIPKARDAYAQSIDIFAEISNPVGEGAGHNGIGLVALFLGDYAPAIESFQRGLAIQQSAGDIYGSSFAFTNIGSTQFFQGDFVNAKASILDALAIQNKFDDPRSKALSLNILGEIELAQGNLEEAKEAFQQAIDLFKHHPNVHRIEIVAGLARVALAQEDYESGKTFAELILDYQNENPGLHGTIYTFRVWMACYDVLTAVSDPRCHKLLNTTYQQLLERASFFTNDADRYSFLNKFPHHRAVIEAVEREE
ncbi:MAG: hypothetical protein DWQ04_04030 [Chloroflexi bacterium]|nr:MAG: hypothetical protein DWQ04_04030 [Chloroflexota bacterium]